MTHARFWTTFVISLLGFNLLAGATLVYFAHNDPSFAAEEDYYQKGLDWDSHVLEQADSDALGWVLDLKIIPGESGDDLIRVTLKGPDDAPIVDADLDLIMFHNARAADKFKAALSPVEPGVYQTEQQLARSGLWQFQFRAQHDDNVFVRSTEIFIP